MMRVNFGRSALVLAIRGYQWFLSPMKVLFFGASGHCRFTPCCSEYAAQAIQTHGVCRGVSLAFLRICRCHPWGDCGHDPVPGRHDQASETNPNDGSDDSNGGKDHQEKRKSQGINVLAPRIVSWRMMTYLRNGPEQ